jgi:hypothetical protein
LENSGADLWSSILYYKARVRTSILHSSGAFGAVALASSPVLPLTAIIVPFALWDSNDKEQMEKC